MNPIVKLFMVLFFVSGACSSGTSIAAWDEITDYAAGNESPGFSGACNTDDPDLNHRGFIRLSLLSAALVVLSTLP